MLVLILMLDSLVPIRLEARAEALARVRVAEQTAGSNGIVLK